MLSSFWPHLRGSKEPPEGNMLEQNPLKLHINQACRFAFGKKTQAKKTQAKNSQKTQENLRKTQFTGNF